MTRMARTLLWLGVAAWAIDAAITGLRGAAWHDVTFSASMCLLAAAFAMSERAP